MRPADLYRRGTGRAIVILGLVAFVLGVYVLVVLGGGVLIGRTDSPSPALSVLATTVVALAFAPVQSVLERATAPHGDAVRRPGQVHRERRRRTAPRISRPACRDCSPRARALSGRRSGSWCPAA